MSCVRWTSSSIIKWQAAQVAASGRDAAQIRDDGPFKFLTLKQVRELVSLSTTQIYRLMALNRFPSPVSLTTSVETEAA